MKLFQSALLQFIIFVVAGFQDETVSHGKKVHLKCSQCKEVFGQAWDLMFHAQNAHGVNIYKLGEKNNSDGH